jgi:Fe-S cluster biosynthesis and repair protein YggX
MGLLARVDNEAQLAFILAHEFTHIERKHSLDLFIETKKINKNVSRYELLKRNDYNEIYINQCRFSKDLESEADAFGLETYLKTDYDIAAIDGSFDVLRYSELPFAELPFERNLLESEHLKIPQSYVLEKVNPIKGHNETEDDSQSTHPNLSKRRAALSQKILGKQAKGNKAFIVSQERFEALQQTIRFEMPQLLLHNQLQQEAIYHAYLLLQQFPENLYLKKSIAKALYALTKYGNNERFVMEPDSIEGQSQQVYQLLYKLSSKELNVVALHYLWQLKKDNPKDAEIAAITKDIFKEFVNNHDEEWSKLSRKPLSEVLLLRNAQELERKKSKAEEAETEKPIEEKPKKISRKNKKIKKEASPIDTITSNWSRFAFVDWLEKDTAFVNTYNRLKAEKVERDSFLAENWEDFLNDQKSEEKKGVRLGVPKVVFVNPFYLNLDARDENNSTQYIKTEDGQSRFKEMLKENAKLAGLDARILDVHDLQASDAETFNDIMLLNEWVVEQQSADDLLLYGSQQARINKIAEKYHTDYFSWTGVVSLHEKKSNFKTALLLLAGIGYFPILPYSIYKTVKPEYNMLFFNTLYDVKTGRLKTIKYDYMKKNDTRGILNSQLYDACLQIKSN